MTKDPENAFQDLHSPQIPKLKHQVTFTNTSHQTTAGKNTKRVKKINLATCWMHTNSTEKSSYDQSINYHQNKAIFP